MAKRTNNKPTPTELRNRFDATRSELNLAILERETAIELALIALLSGEHFIQLGPPGVAKSLLVREICKRITGASYYEKLFSQTTEPNEVFGPIDLKALSDKGQYKRISKGAIQASHIVFLDEVFKANSTILNCLLTLSNERLYHEVGYEPQKAPLLSIFGASNETPQDKSLTALYDRFPLKLVVTDTIEESSFEALVQGSFGAPVTSTITIDDITEAQKLVKLVTIGKEVVEGLKRICRIEAPTQGIRVSDRTIVKAAKIVRAKAWLDGRDEATLEDLTILAHCLWSEPKETKAVERFVFEIANPLHLRAIEKEDSAKEVFEQFPSDGDWQLNFDNAKRTAENVIKQLVDIDTELENEIITSKAKDKSRAATALTQIREWKDAVNQKNFRYAAKRSSALPGIGG
jgi:MoxR-like ATPase